MRLAIMLKPQDTLLALKYWSLQRSGQHLAVRDLAASLGMSASEASKGAKRLLAARLLVAREGAYYAEVNALSEWLSFGVRYAYAVEEKGYGRGIGTGWSCELVKTDMVPPSPGVIWAVPGGMQEGIIVEPIYKGVPLAASYDPLLYQALALIDAIRLGRPRELAIARASLKRLLMRRESDE
jgi:hypothetical protein